MTAPGEEKVRKKRAVRAILSRIWTVGAASPVLPDAKCKGNTKPLWDFQVSDAEKPLVRSRRHNKAIAICGLCPERDRCLAWGIANEMSGVWGGVVLVPNGRSYLRCDTCGYAMIRSRYQLPPRGFRNMDNNNRCMICAKAAA